MNAVHLKLAIVVAIGAALLLMAGPVLGSEPVIEEVIVKAPMVNRTQIVDISESGVRTELVELRRRVSYADLDLEFPEDVNRLEARIEAMAREACEALDEMFPLDREIGDVDRCIRRAVVDAQVEVDKLIAAG